MFPDLSIYFGEFNIIITDEIMGKIIKNKMQIVINLSLPLRTKFYSEHAEVFITFIMDTGSHRN